MPQQSPVSWLLAATFVALGFCATAAAQPLQPCPGPVEPRAEVLLRDHSRLCPGTSGTFRRLPVLFVHGHHVEVLSSEEDDPNYVNNWQESLPRILRPSLPSFLQTLEANPDLGIEDYYIRFRDQNRSISDDAADIANAIELILHRHDPGYPARGTTNVQVVIIAYSKGTISSRRYLKNLEAENRSFKPISEFIAISPPNHGITLGSGETCASQEMMKGQDANCQAFSALPACPNAATFLTDLNTPDEAPGSRGPGSQTTPTKPTDGILYVTIFDEGSDDFVGGDDAQNDCAGRKLATNLSPNAVKVEVDIVGVGEITIHQRTVHTPLVICKALFTAVHHRAPGAEDCGLAADAVNPPVIPPPARAAAVLALDFSGSMSLPTGPNATRATVLKEATQLFIELWNLVGVPSDHLGAVFFRSNVTRFQSPSTGEVLPPLEVGGPELIIDVRDNQQPGGLTAMGGALQQAIDTLNGDSSAIRRVILFTDGMQNVAPLVEDNNGQLYITDPANTLASHGIAVDTIGIGASQAFVGLLEDIALQTNGNNQTTVNVNLLREFFIGTLINALKGFSPQLVGYRRGVVTRNTTETFAVEEGVQKLVLKLSWKRGDSLSFKVAKDGVDVTSAGRFIDGEFYKFFVIDLPGKRSINARGNWQIQISGRTNTGYEAAAIVDGSKIKYDAFFDGKRSSAGDPLDLVVRLTHDGRPLSGATINVSMFRPTTTAGNLIAKKRPKELPSLEPNMTPGERQLVAFDRDRKRLDALKPKEEKIVRQANEKGELRIPFSPQVPGVYTARVTITGEAPGQGRFSRTQTVTRVVRFAKPDSKASGASASEWTATGPRRYVGLTLTPRDSRGHFLGPGLPTQITLKLSSGKTVGAVRDLGDGKYMLLIETLPGADPTVTLFVAGDPLFDGPLSKLLTKPKK